jgi:hypothetical protein
LSIHYLGFGKTYGAGLVLVGLGTAAGVGRGATGRPLALAGREFELRVAPFTFGRFTFALLAVLAFVRFAFAAAFALAGRFTFAFGLAFAFALPLEFTFVFLGRLGLFSFALDEFAGALEFAFASGVTVSGDSPSFAARLISIATVCPVFTTSPARGN